MTMLREVFLENRDLKWYEQDPISVQKTLVRHACTKVIYTRREPQKYNK